MALSTAVLAPVVEELLFRGLLWNLFERWLPAVVPFVLTTVAFALIHGSGQHILGIVPHAIAMGLLRYTSKSLWPPMLLHFVNNALAVLLMRLLTDADFPSLLAWPMALGFVGLGAQALVSRER